MNRPGFLGGSSECSGRFMAAIELNLSNSKLDGLNSKIRLINHLGDCHHSAEAIGAAALPLLRWAHDRATHDDRRRVTGNHPYQPEENHKSYEFETQRQGVLIQRNRVTVWPSA